ncbi:hypothetical protein AYI70_g155 [Smittium culicis]|uniref:Uncharacterized protein n=1 Tax=Smittium culicis TaxID=133412 RepID=A0A1R1YI18_9FUNG|nr:hypothetical protein AYI70_g155 [Smittium culicis]
MLFRYNPSKRNFKFLHLLYEVIGVDSSGKVERFDSILLLNSVAIKNFMMLTHIIKKAAFLSSLILVIMMYWFADI